MRNFFLLILIILLLPQIMYAQVRPNFPYSALGVGEINYNAQGMLSGMGNATSAMRSTAFLNNSNPASYSALPQQMVLLEISGKGSSATLQTAQERATSNDFSVSRLALGFKFNRFWGSSIGILPVSTMHYHIVSPQQVGASNQIINSVFEGDGGLNQFYWANAFQLGKHFSLGVQGSYIFGSLNQTEKVGYDISNPYMDSEQKTFLRGFQFDGGIQYFTKLNKDWDFTLGLNYINKRSLNAQYSVSITSGADTLNDQIVKNDYFTIPSQYRGGMAFTYAHKLTFALDYTFEKWNNLSAKEGNVALVNSQRYGAGVQWYPVTKTNLYENKILNRMMFEGGLNYNRSYLQISQQQIKDINASLGIGISNKAGNLTGTAGFEIGQEGTFSSNLINEHYVNFYCSFIFRDIWFVKHKYY